VVRGAVGEIWKYDRAQNNGHFARAFMQFSFALFPVRAKCNIVNKQIMKPPTKTRDDNVTAAYEEVRAVS